MAKIYSKIMFFAVLVLLIAGFAISAGCTGTQNADTAAQTEIPATEQTAEMTKAPAETPVSPPEAVFATEAGDGSKNIKMSLDDGISLLKFEQDAPVVSVIAVNGGTSYFSIQNKFPADKSVYVNENGNYVSSQAFVLIGGNYTDVSVETESNWTLSFSFPQMINGIVPQTFKGAGNQATPFFQINEGNYKFTIKTENNTEIEVHLMDYDGNSVMKDDRELPLAFHEGVYDGDVTVKIEKSNNYLLNIICDGDWTVSVD